jgi:disulfide bond formation protein DsbB
MDIPTETINLLFAIGTIGLQVVALGLLAAFLIPRTTLAQRTSHLLRFALPAAFAVTTFGVLISLFYSEIVGYPPCSLCWLQRVFLYPQPIILGIALWHHDRRAADYVMVLSALGAVVALYNYYIQMGGVSGFACPTGGEVADCTRRYVFAFNYITIPMMSLTTFIVLALTMLHVRRLSAPVIEDNTFNTSSL